MTISNLTTLISEVSRWLGGSSDTQFEDAIRTAIQLTEADLNNGFIAPDGRRIRGLRVPEMIVIASEDFDEKYELLPDGFIEMRAAYYVDADSRESPLSAVNEERIARYERVTNDCPRHYVVTGGLIRFAPRVLGETVKIRLVYYAKVPGLLAGGVTTILVAYPQVYLYGALAHMEGYLIGDQRIPQWKALFGSSVVGANMAAHSRAGAYAA